MDIASKKLIFIEKYIQLKNEKLVDKLSAILGNELSSSVKAEKDLSDFFGIISEEESVELKTAIENGCEKIDYNEW